MSDTKKQGFSSSLGVLSVFLIWQFMIICTPVLKSLQTLYPDVPYSTIQLVSTLPSLMIVPASLISGNIVGKKIRYKTMCVLSIAVLFVAGLIPCFIDGFAVLMASRVLFGIGEGLSQPLGNALAIKLYDKEKASNMVGLGGTVKNISGVVLQNLAGVVCVLNIKYVWLVHSLLIIPLLLILFFLPEPAKEETVVEEKPKEKVKLPSIAYILSAAYGILFIVYYPLLLNMSAIVVGEEIGTAANAGTIASMYTIGGMVAGVAFSPMLKKLGKHTIPVSLVLQILGTACGYFGHSMFMFMAAEFITGISVYIIMFAIMMDFKAVLPNECVAPASAFFVAVLQFSAFLATLYSKLIVAVSGSEEPRLPIGIGLVFTLIISVVWIVAIYRKKQKEA